MKYNEFKKILEKHDTLLEKMILSDEIDIDALDKITTEAKTIKKESFQLNKKEADELNKIINKIFEKIEIMKKKIFQKIQKLQHQEKATISYLKNKKK